MADQTLLVDEYLDALAKGGAARSESTIQSNISAMLIASPLSLGEDAVESLKQESPVGLRRRIDIQFGRVLIEVKKSLDTSQRRGVAHQQLEEYMTLRHEEFGHDFIGILSDGKRWISYRWDRSSGTAKSVSEFTLKGRGDADDFFLWLDGITSTSLDIEPTQQEIYRRLGAGSTGHLIDCAALRDLYVQGTQNPKIRGEIALKRLLWGRLLETALGTQFDDNDDLFIEHTLLVNSAEIIAHLLLGLDISESNAASILSGEQFSSADVHGVVEADFFDWVVQVPGGDSFVARLVQRLSRFNWGNVTHDVLKALYESVVSREIRKKLGEYYTPDWLAEYVVQSLEGDPIEQRVLDPACGSGTFLFHAVKRFLAAADEKGLENKEALEALTTHVVGMDLHPVAVTLARVTYLLAIGRERLVDERDSLHVPVFLGDSIHWSHKELDVWSGDELVIQAEDLLRTELRFPADLVADANRFDGLISELAHKVEIRPGKAGQRKIPSIKAILKRNKVPKKHVNAVKESFAGLCNLYDAGWNHIWSYYIRNLARPMWLSRSGNAVDVVVGNPPWVAFRYMSKAMQQRFRQMSTQRGLWKGKSVTTNQDLSSLFVRRVLELYVKEGGEFAFVMPSAVLGSGQFAGFRKSNGIEFGEAVDLRQVRPHFFPTTCSIVRGRKKHQSKKLTTMRKWVGRVPRGATRWLEVEQKIEVSNPTKCGAVSEYLSPYREQFLQGASIVPRLLFRVSTTAVSPLGAKSGRTPIESQRTNYEKKPWKNLPSLKGLVEGEFVRQMLFSEHIVPYRQIGVFQAVIPVLEGRLLDASMSAEYPGLAKWLRTAESIWKKHRSKTTTLSLSEQIDYRNKLSSQFPIGGTRVVYNASGMHLSAAIVRNKNCIVDYKLYWARVKSKKEAYYLCAVLNSALITEAVRPFMSFGKDERDIDKHVWKLPIMRFDPKNPSHARLSELGKAAEREVAKIDLSPFPSYIYARRAIREDWRKVSETALEIESLVEELL